MRTNIVLNEDLLKKAFKVSKSITKKDLVHEALTEYVETHGRKNLMDLKGKIKFKKDYSYKKLRKGRQN